jgi:hypothetical protein
LPTVAERTGHTFLGWNVPTETRREKMEIYEYDGTTYAYYNNPEENRNGKFTKKP